MKVRVLFFGATAASVGTRVVETILGDRATPTDLMQHLTAEHPGLRTGKLLFAVNEEYVDGNVALSDGDEIAIFTPVSGG